MLENSSATQPRRDFPQNPSAESVSCRRSDLVLCAILIIGTLLVFWRVRSFDFLNYDDPEYVTENPVVQQGVTGAGIAWALRTSAASNWHPLTWISHMMDCQFFALNPAAHHFTNVLFHAANAFLLFLVLKRMTGATWRSFFVATIFAVHPLRVESVAWVSERKDVLSAFFWMLTMWFYVRYVEETKVQSSKAKAFYAVTLLAFALGLLSKPVVVTLPFALLLLDVWPLGRLRSSALAPNEPETLSSSSGTFNFPRLLAEKIPFFILTVVASVITFTYQNKEGAVSSLQSISFVERLENALVAYPRYIGKLFWPTDLTALYPHPRQWPLWIVAGCTVIVLALTIVAVRWARRMPYFTIGWFWFLGTLVPMIGLVQVGLQSIADRYTYIPTIGLLVIVAWGADDFLRTRLGGKFLFTIAAAATAACVAVTLDQLPFWQNSIVLYQRVLTVGYKNPLYRNALEKFSPYADVRNNFGHALADAGQYRDAIAQYQVGLQLDPKHSDLMDNLANALSQSGHPDQAIPVFIHALELYPTNATLHTDLGVAFGMMGKIEEATAQLQQAVKLNPESGSAHANLGNALASQGKLTEAISEFALAVRLKPFEAFTHFNFGVALAQSGRRDEAAAQFREALRLKPDYEPAKQQLSLLGK